MSEEQAYIKYGKWSVYGWKAHAVVELWFAAHILAGVLIGYLLWGYA